MHDLLALCGDDQDVAREAAVRIVSRLPSTSTLGRYEDFGPSQWLAILEELTPRLNSQALHAFPDQARQALRHRKARALQALGSGRPVPDDLPGPVDAFRDDTLSALKATRVDRSQRSAYDLVCREVLQQTLVGEHPRVADLLQDNEELEQAMRDLVAEDRSLADAAARRLSEDDVRQAMVPPGPDAAGPAARTVAQAEAAWLATRATVTARVADLLETAAVAACQAQLWSYLHTRHPGLRNLIPANGTVGAQPQPQLARLVDNDPDAARLATDWLWTNDYAEVLQGTPAPGAAPWTREQAEAAWLDARRAVLGQDAGWTPGAQTADPAAPGVAAP